MTSLATYFQAAKYYIADLLTDGLVERHAAGIINMADTIERLEHKLEAYERTVKLLRDYKNHLEGALDQIVAAETPKANGTVIKLCNIARKALGKTTTRRMK